MEHLKLSACLLGVLCKVSHTVQALRLLDNAMDTIIEKPDDPKSGWSILERWVQACLAPQKLSWPVMMPAQCIGSGWLAGLLFVTQKP